MTSVMKVLQLHLVIPKWYLEKKTYTYNYVFDSNSEQADILQ